jgi:hypothetical protein
MMEKSTGSVLPQRVYKCSASHTHSIHTLVVVSAHTNAKKHTQDRVSVLMQALRALCLRYFASNYTMTVTADWCLRFASKQQ